MDNKLITVRSAEGEPNTEAEIIIQNKIKYTPKVSVVVPVYNVEPYLEECLNSIIKQTLKEIEIICVDDGSTDNSLKILQEYAKKDKRFTIITQKNSGAGKSRNHAMEVATGKYIAFMDPDDFYPDRGVLLCMYKAAEENNVLICGGDAKFWEGNHYISPWKDWAYPRTGLIKYTEYQYDYGYWRLIYNREFLKDNDLYFPDYLRGQDPPFFVRAMCLAENFYVLDIPTYVYRTSYKKINWTQKRVYDFLCSQQDLLEMAEKYGLTKLHNVLITRSRENWWIEVVEMYANDKKVATLSNKLMRKYQNFCKRITYKSTFKLLSFIPLLSIEEQ